LNYKVIICNRKLKVMRNRAVLYVSLDTVRTVSRETGAVLYETGAVLYIQYQEREMQSCTVSNSTYSRLLYVQYEETGAVLYVQYPTEHTVSNNTYTTANTESNSIQFIQNYVLYPTSAPDTLGEERRTVSRDERPYSFSVRRDLQYLCEESIERPVQYKDRLYSI
jgi:hypothetical protein